MLGNHFIAAVLMLSAATCGLAQKPAASKQANTAKQQAVTNNAPATGTINASGFSSGLGTFNNGDVTLTVFNCLRSGTRVFCDYDVAKNQTQTVNAAGFTRWQVTMAVGSGRVFNTQHYMYVDQDGSTFQTAELTSNVLVRMVAEYDDVPASYNSVSLAFGAKRIQNIPITLIPEGQAANNIPLRQVTTAPVQSAQSGAQQQQVQQQTQPQQAVGNNTSNSSATKATQSVNKAKTKAQSLLDKWGSITH